jgi:signal transduction histidine kinase
LLDSRRTSRTLSHPCEPNARRDTIINIAHFIDSQRDAIVAEWIAVADALTPRELSAEELLDAVHDMLDSIVHALLESTAPTEHSPSSSVGTTSELMDVAKAHAAHRFAQRSSLKQMAGEYRALRANITRRWLASGTAKTEAAAMAEELALFDAAVDASLISAIAWYDDRLKQHQEHLRTANQNQSEFLAVLGHELRNPLAPLRTGLDLLERAQAEPALLDMLRPMLERQFSNLARLVDDLLDFSRINRGQITLHTARIDLNSAIETGAEQLAAPIKARRNELHLELSPSPLPVVGDFDRLTQVIANLLSNANKYTQSGGRITVRSYSQHKKAIVSVMDTGYGIPPEQLDRIFDLFAQVPEHRARSAAGGLGIGLALVRRLLDMHGGTIEARSRGLGHGSDFVVTLPLAQAGALDDDSIGRKT